MAAKNSNLFIRVCESLVQVKKKYFMYVAFWVILWLPSSVKSLNDSFSKSHGLVKTIKLLNASIGQTVARIVIKAFMYVLEKLTLQN